jgi:Uma2 family endonuclease
LWGVLANALLPKGLPMAVSEAPAQTMTLITGEELEAMGNIGPSELVEGRIVPMSPTAAPHAICEGNFYDVLKQFARRQKSGKVMVGDVGIYTRRNPDSIRAADVAYISNQRYEQRKRKGDYLNVAPELVVEVLSPDDRWQEVMHKLREYFAVGVQLVWVADPDEQTVYAYRSPTDVREFKSGGSLTADDIMNGFVVTVADLFEQ